MSERPAAGNSPVDDQTILLRAAQGDPEATTRLAEDVAPILRAALQREMPQRWQALLTVDDVIQQAWADAVIGLRRFEPRGPGAFAAWMLTLARNNLRNAIRMLEADKRGGARRGVPAVDRDTSYLGLLEAVAGDGGTPSREVALDEVRQALDRAIEGLPETYRTVVRGYDLDGRSAQEIAEELGRTSGAVHMLRSRALHALAELLGSPSGLLTRR